MMDAPEEIGNAIGSTEATAEERCHWTLEMRALAERDGEETPAKECGPVGLVKEFGLSVRKVRIREPPRDHTRTVPADTEYLLTARI
jgi:hypothetical protein